MTNTPTRETVEALLALEAKATPGLWNMQDFADPAISSDPSVRDVTVSCTWPDHIGIASMERGLTATLEEARANAELIAAARNLAKPLAEAYLATLDAKTILTPTHVGYAVAPNAAAPMCAQGQIYSTMVGPISGGRGGMVDAPDLKSGFSEGSNPSGPTTLDARREGQRKALRGMREWCDELRRAMEGCADNWCKGQHRASERAITEIDRRLAEGETT